MWLYRPFLGHVYSGSCSGNNWWVHGVDWVIDRIDFSETAENELVITKTNVMGRKYVKFGKYSLDATIGHGIFALTMTIWHKTNVAFNGRSVLTVNYSSE